MTKPNFQRVHFGWNAESVRLELFNDDGTIIESFKPFNPITRSEFVKKSKEHNKTFTDKFGITPSRFVDIARGIFYEQIIKPNPEWAKLCRKSNWIPRQQMQEFLEHTELIEQCVKDNTKHLIPLVCLFGRDSKGLREMFGKGMWKRVVKNSYSRNRLIFIEITGREAVSDRWWGNGAEGKYPRRQREFLYLNEFPSTLLKSRWVKGRDNQQPYWMFKTALEHNKYPMNVLLKGRFWGDNECDKTIHCIDIIRDTKGMATALQQPFDEKWTYRRIKEEHDRLTLLQAIALRKKREEADAAYKARLTIDFRTLHKWLDVYEYNGVKATPLLNMKEVQEEGDKQHHCVGGYAERCADKGYVVYSLEKDGVKSTLGINVNGMEFTTRTLENGSVECKTSKFAGYKFQQHYLAYNRPVTDPDMVKCAELVVSELNERNKEVKDEDQSESK